MTVPRAADWALSRDDSALQRYALTCLSCNESSPASPRPDEPEAWAVDHATRTGKGARRHRTFARTIIDRWTAEPSRPRARQRTTLEGDRVFQLMKVRGDGVYVGDLLALGDGLHHRVDDLRWAPSRRHRLALLRGLREPFPLEPRAQYEVRRPHSLQQQLIRARLQAPPPTL